MSKKKQKYYVVWNGIEPGVYYDWEEAKLQVNGYFGAKFKAFEDENQAFMAFEEDPRNHIGLNKGEKHLETNEKSIKSIKKIPELINEGIIVKNSICVDAACAGNPGIVEYRAVVTLNKKEVFHKGPLAHGTNNVGEFLAIVHALAFCKQYQKEDITIYSDSLIAIKWVKLKNPKTKLIKNDKNSELFELLKKATLWINENKYLNPIVHWNTEAWGENPADFGRK